MNKIPILDEKDLNGLIEQALKNGGDFTAPMEYSKMLINIKGVSINDKPRKDGRWQGYVIDGTEKRYVYGKSKEEVAIKIKERLKNGFPKKKKANTQDEVPTTFNAFAMYFFENFRKKKVAKDTFRSDLNRYKNYLLKEFKEKPLKKITPKECQDLIEQIIDSKKGKTADEIYSLLSIIFKAAIKHGLILRNPLDIICVEKHVKKHGTALTKNEEQFFKAKIGVLTDEKLKQGFFLMLYTGLRPNELKTVQIKGKFIIAKNSKRKSKKIEYKRIPIISNLAPYIMNGILSNFSERFIDKMRATIKEILPNHILYDLRTTFYTRCKEYGVTDVALKHFVGHSLGELGNTYTDLSDEYLLKEAEKLAFWKD